MRDTGCSTVVINRKLVSPEQLTGKDETCVLIDGTVRRVPVAEIEMSSPYFSGKVRAVCMRNTPYDVIIGNVTGARDPELEEKMVAISTEPNIRERSVDNSEASDHSAVHSLNVDNSHLQMEDESIHDTESEVAELYCKVSPQERKLRR